MASSCGRTHAAKAAFVVGFLLILLNLLGPRWDSSKPMPFSMKQGHWPKRTHPLSESQTNNLTETTKIEDLVKETNISMVGEDVAVAKNLTGVNANSTVVILTNSVAGSLSAVNVSVPKTTPKVVVTNKTAAAVTRPKTRKEFITALMQQLGINPCPAQPEDLDGPIDVDTMYEPLEVVEKRLGSRLLSGGRYHPKRCNSKHRVAIIVPYRDREQHLPIFLKNLHPFLMKQQIDYGIFIVEQSSTGAFNRAKLMNIGFVEAIKMYNWDCFIFHDVDLLPMDDRNLYTCPEQPRHMSVAVDTMGFKLPYNTIFGGVSAMTVEQFLAVNGFSNSFWGWGGEDDDMSNRLKHRGYHISRYPVNIARYTMLTHRKEKANPRRYEKLMNGAKHYDNDGLNSLKYKVLEIKKTPLYIWIQVDINQDAGS